jgi:hypothetical protein
VNASSRVKVPCHSFAAGYSDGWADRNRHPCPHSPPCEQDGYSKGHADGLADRLLAEGYRERRTDQNREGAADKRLPIHTVVGKGHKPPDHFRPEHAFSRAR